MGLITFKIDDSRAVAKLRLVGDAAKNPAPVYATIGNILVNRIKLCFKLGIDPWGSPWAKVKWRTPRLGKKGAPTKAGKAQIKANAEGNAGSPLVNTGLLRNSITARKDANGVTVGTNQMPRAAALQFGATIKPKNAKTLAFPGPMGTIVFAKKVVLPARNFMPLRRPNGDVQLPVEWTLDVVRAIKAHLIPKA